ncbi:hypothetical protein IHQ71_04230 [Rhizobium sp. TH2]|uniref:hypothetical protein n=1 Tax=Rhizobium sp. TH2 TaxID=2775403 RepID=UPI0021572930|nr:hypothetical protein [Rhizobium sp. TH2]UVC09829.1 hypothetical protein IHQ71_04230 [Rhizobium sp. TH2]
MAQISRSKKASPQAFRTYLSKRQPSSEKKINWGQWIGSPTAWLALFISASTAFYSMLYVRDEAKIVFDKHYIKVHNKDWLAINSPRTITFVNSGNRPIAITEVLIDVVQPFGNYPDPQLCSESGDHSVFDMDFEQTAIKPFDIVVKPFRFQKTSVQEMRAIPMSAVNKGRRKQVGHRKALVCAHVTFVVSDAEYRQSVLLFSGWFEGGQQNRKFLIEEPVTVIKRSLFGAGYTRNQRHYWCTDDDGCKHNILRNNTIIRDGTVKTL